VWDFAYFGRVLGGDLHVEISERSKTWASLAGKVSGKVSRVLKRRGLRGDGLCCHI